MTRLLTAISALFLIGNLWSVSQAENTEKKPEDTPPLIIQDITFKKKNGDSEALSVHLNRYFWPVITHALDKEPPSLELEWTQAIDPGKKLSEAALDGRWMNRLRSRYDDEKKILTVFLDLKPNVSYRISQEFNHAENVFTIVISPESEGKKTEGYDASGNKIEPPPQNNVSVQLASLINDWKKAWESKQINNYLSFYHKDFHNDGKNFSAWKNSKSKTFERVNRITLILSDIKIKTTDNSAAAFFKQIYQSDAYQDEGYKVLEFMKENDTWKICRETWFAEKPEDWLADP